MTEAPSADVNMTFTISIGSATASTVTVTYATADGTAKAPDDYVALPTTRSPLIRAMSPQNRSGNH